LYSKDTVLISPLQHCIAVTSWLNKQAAQYWYEEQVRQESYILIPSFIKNCHKT